MRYRKLSPTGDYTFGNNQKDFYRDVPEAPGQAIQTRLRLWLGEWFLNTASGTQYMQGVLGAHPNPLQTADVVIQQRALRTQGVDGLRNYQSSLNPDTRAMRVALDADTIYGPTAVQLENYGNY